MENKDTQLPIALRKDNQLDVFIAARRDIRSKIAEAEQRTILRAKMARARARARRKGKIKAKTKARESPRSCRTMMRPPPTKALS